MRLAVVTTGGIEQTAIICHGATVPISELNRQYGFTWPTDLFEILENDHLNEISEWWNGLADTGIRDLRRMGLDPSKVRYAPLLRHPRKIIGIGLNYREHAGDLDESAPQEEPASFMKPATTIIGPSETILLPVQSDRVTGEAELAVIIGKVTSDVSEEEAPDHVAGFTTIIDMTAEDILRKNPRYLTRAKSFNTFLSIGPQLVTPDEVEDLDGLKVATVLNGRVQRENVIANMTFKPWMLVSFMSKVMTLLPGDLILTGTPGAAVLRDGDVVECRIEGFESLSNPVVDPYKDIRGKETA